MLFGLSLALTQSPAFVQGDTSAPQLQSATVNAVALLLTYDEALNELSVPAPGDFAVTVDLVARSVSNVSVASSAVTLTLASAVAPGEDVAISYTPSLAPIEDVAGNDAVSLLDLGVTNNTADTTAPVLSAPLAAETGATTFDWAVDTNEVGGTLYWVVSTSATVPSAVQVLAGQDHTGSAAAASGNQLVAASGPQNGLGTGLSASTSYTWFALHRDLAGNHSNIVNGTFTTQAGGAFPSAVTVKFGDLNGRTAHFGVELEGASNYTTDPGSWDGVGTPATLSLGTSNAVPSGGAATDFVVEGAGIKAAPLAGGLTPGTYSWTGCQFDGVGPTFTLNATVEANAVYLSPRGTYGEVEFFRWIKSDKATFKSGKTAYLRYGMYDTMLNRYLESWPSRVDYNNAFDNLTARCTVRAADFNHLPMVSELRLGASSATDVPIGPLTFEYIDFFCPQDSLYNGGSNPNAQFWLLKRSGGDHSDLTVRNCVFRSDYGLPQDRYTYKAQLSGIETGGDNIAIEDSEFRNLWNAMFLGSGDGLSVQRNTCREFWADFIFHEPHLKNVIIKDNFVTDPTCDGAFIHGDFLQTRSEGAQGGGADMVNWQITGNIVTMGALGSLNLPVIDWDKEPFSWQPRYLNASTAIPATDVNRLVRGDTAAANVTATLPAASAFASGQYICVQKWDPGAVNTFSIAPDGADTIDGIAAPLNITAGFQGYRLTSDGVSNWSASSQGAANGLQGMLFQDSYWNRNGKVRFDNIIIDHNVLWLNSITGIRMGGAGTGEGAALNSRWYRNTSVRPFATDERPNTPNVRPIITIGGAESTAVIENLMSSGGPEEGGLGEDNITGWVATEDWSDLVPFFNGVAQTDFEPRGKAEALSQALADPTGPLWTNGQRGALGTTAANGSYNFDTLSYTTGALAAVGPDVLPSTAHDACLKLDSIWKFGPGGTVTVKRQSDDTVITTYTLPADKLSWSGGSVYARGTRLCVKPPQPAGEWPEDFYLEVSVGVIEAMDGTAFSIADSMTWTHTLPTGIFNLLRPGSENLGDPNEWYSANLTITWSGGESAYQVAGTGANQLHRLDTADRATSYLADPESGVAYCYDLEVKKVDTTNWDAEFLLPWTGQLTINLDTGAVVNSGPAEVAVTTEEVNPGSSDGWWRVKFAFTGTGARLLFDTFRFSGGETFLARNPRLYVTP
ncbi:MAG: SwmB domain-containing protein [Kiloniellales bacterium]